MLAITVPSPVIPLTATLYVVPLPVTTAVVAPAVPLSVTSPPAKSDTASLKVANASLSGYVFFDSNNNGQHLDSQGKAKLGFGASRWNWNSRKFG